MSVVHLDGQYALSAEHERIAEIIKDYEPSLELAWVPPNLREHNEEFPFAVIHRPEDAPAYVVFKLRANEVDHRVLSRLFLGDNRNHNVLDVIETEEAAKQLVEMKRQEDEAAERQELAAWAIKARPGAKHNGVRFD